MVISHNLNALNATNRLNTNVVGTKKSTEKLSSGLQINRAADNAAGLAISEKMRAQIRGLHQAINNANDGISLIQTAEGGLNETHAILQRIRELAVQSANGTYQNETDREAMQLEVDRLKAEIDRIAESTEYNKIKLLDGSLGGKDISSSALYGARYGTFQYSAAFSQYISVASSIAGVSVEFTTGASGLGGENAEWSADGKSINIKLSQGQAYTDAQINELIKKATQAKNGAQTNAPASIEWKTATGMIIAADFTAAPTVAGLRHTITLDLLPLQSSPSGIENKNAIFADKIKFTANQYGSHNDTKGLFASIGIVTDTDAGQEKVTIDTSASMGAGANITLHLATGVEYTSQYIEQLLMKAGFDYTVEMWDDNAVDGGETAMFTVAGEAQATFKQSDVNVYRYLYGTWFQDAVNVISARAGMTAAQDFTLNVKFDYQDSNAVAWVTSYIGVGYNPAYSPSLTFNLKYIQPDGTFATPDGAELEVDAGLYMDRLITHEITHALMHLNLNPGMSPITGNSPVPLWYTEGLAEAVQGFNRYTNTTTDTLTKTPMQINAEIQALSNATTDSTVYSAGYLFVNWLDNYGTNSGTGAGRIKDLTEALKTAGTFDAALTTVYGKNSTTLLSEFKAESATASANQAAYIAWLDTKLNIQIGDGRGDALNNVDANKSAIVPNSGSGKNINLTSDTVMLNGLQVVTLSWDFTNTKAANAGIGAGAGGTDGQGLGKGVFYAGGDGLILQIGANGVPDQKMSVYINDMGASALGVANVDVSTQDAANAAIETVDNAINRVSLQRASLGAAQNRLEYTVNNLTVTEENLTAAESQIRDTDMAKEMVEYTKYSILQQAAQAMLAQANQSTQSVLQLLQ